ncbi:pupal cuticle protein 36a-like [Penaeus chinensis]|uniref:pupal cuticle protein 36a-like n=1 Tax=Penaeus chinensis TaxID=139456 RepID=UPI001FB64542|nr:pupal cuticle protein 36a-like [Penaeus chinensis]
MNVVIDFPFKIKVLAQRVEFRVIVATVVVSSAAPQGYHLDKLSGPSFGLRGSDSGSGTGGLNSGFGTGGLGSGFGIGTSDSGFGAGILSLGSGIGGLASGFSTGGCGPGRVLHIDGRCVTPRVNRKVYLYDAPPVPVSHGPPPYIPEPTVETNILFIRAPEQGQGPDPIVIPPPRQEHVVYVLNKESLQQQEVIELPAPPASEPEVYFVNYGDGENPVLPSGVDLQTALNAASQGGGQVVGGGAGGVGGGFGGSGGIGGFGSGEIGGFGSGGIVCTICLKQKDVPGDEDDRCREESVTQRKQVSETVEEAVDSEVEESVDSPELEK